MTIGWMCAVPASEPALPPQTLAILPSVVDGPYGGTRPSLVFDAIREVAERRVGLEVLSYNRVMIEGSESLATTAARCGSDATCLRQVLRVAQVDLGLRTIVSYALDPPLVTMSLVSPSAGARARTAAFEIGRSTDLRTILKARAQALLEEAGFALGGRLVLQIDPPDASVRVGEGTAQPDPGTLHAYTLPQGRYVVAVSKDGFSSEETEVELVAGESIETNVTLSPVASGGILSRWWFWTAVGVAAAGAAAAVVVATDPFGGSTGGCLCITTEGTPCSTCP